MNLTAWTRHEPAVAGTAAVMDAVDTFPDPVLIIDGGCRIAGVNEPRSWNFALLPS